jgi:hypothetical protein
MRVNPYVPRRWATKRNTFSTLIAGLTGFKPWSPLGIVSLSSVGNADSGRDSVFSESLFSFYSTESGTTNATRYFKRENKLLVSRNIFRAHNMRRPAKYPLFFFFFSALRPPLIYVNVPLPAARACCLMLSRNVTACKYGGKVIPQSFSLFQHAQ